MAGQSTAIKRWLTRRRSHSREEEIVAPQSMRLNDEQSSMFRTIFVLQILYTHPFVLGSMRGLIPKTEIHPVVPQRI
jgi:hypothetical protein